MPAGESLGAVPMDAILNCSQEDLEDYYNLLGCDELSTVRASFSLPAYSQFECARVSSGNLQVCLCGQECLKCLVHLLVTRRISLGKLSFLSCVFSDNRSLEEGLG